MMDAVASRALAEGGRRHARSTKSCRHPIGMLLDSFKQAGVAAPSVAEHDGKGFFTIESEADLLAKWKRILAGKPDR